MASFKHQYNTHRKKVIARSQGDVHDWKTHLIVPIFEPICFICCSCLAAKSCPTLWNHMDCSTPGCPVLHCLPEFAQTHVRWIGCAIYHILCLPLLLLPSILSRLRVFFNESALRIKWPKYWSFSFSISPSNEYPGLVSFRMDWLNLLAVQGTLKSFLQHHNSKASILRHWVFFMVQLTSTHDSWKYHSFDYTDLCQQSDVSVCFPKTES